jgi:hypothetical protein
VNPELGDDDCQAVKAEILDAEDLGQHSGLDKTDEGRQAHESREARLGASDRAQTEAVRKHGSPV